ncbi:MAG: Lrp/AsnC family transcriptional regulator [Candidatus Woesearchaeota archaeon]
MKIDEKDLAIIQELRSDSRKTIRDIAKRTGIRPSTVHIRIGRLIQEKVIEKFTLKVNNEAFGENFIAFLLIKTTGEIKKNVFNHPAVREVFGITGEYDLMIKVKFRDIGEFHKFLLKFRKEDNVGETVTMVSTITIKEEL